MQMLFSRLQHHRATSCTTAVAPSPRQLHKFTPFWMVMPKMGSRSVSCSLGMPVPVWLRVLHSPTAPSRSKHTNESRYSASVPSFNAHRWRCARLIARMATRTPIAYVCTLPPCSECMLYDAMLPRGAASQWRKGESTPAYTQLIGIQYQHDSHKTPANCCPH